MRFDIQEKSGNQYRGHNRGQPCLLRVKKLDSGVRQLGFKSQMSLLLAQSSWLDSCCSVPCFTLL